MPEVQTRTISRLKLLSLMAMFIGPLLIAVILFYFGDRLSLPTARSHGELIEPIQQLKAFTLESLSGDTITRDALQGKWSLIYYGSSDCDLVCEANLFKMRQVRLSLGKDTNRVQRFYFLTDDKAIDELTLLLRQYPDLIVARPKSLMDMPLAGLEPGRIYLADPLGNVMMRYDPDTTSKGLRQDLSKLLRVSQIG